MNNNIALIIAAVIVAVGLTLSNGVFVMSGVVAPAAPGFAGLAAVVTNKITSPITLHGTPYGPSSAGYGLESGQLHEVPWKQFSQTVLDVQDYLEKNLSIPSVIWLGTSALNPESYLLALSTISRLSLDNSPVLERVSIVPAELASKQSVAKDSVAIWDWPIFPTGFHAPHLMELASLQAWTLKPAILHSVGSSEDI